MTVVQLRPNHKRHIESQFSSPSFHWRWLWRPLVFLGEAST
jgi:hypothetical protein